MPQTGDSLPPPPKYIVIPPSQRKVLKDLGYNGPWKVTKQRARELLKMVQDSGGGNPPSDDQQNFLELLASLLGGGSGGSSGSSAPRGLSPEQKRNLRNSYLEQLTDWGIGVTGNLDNLMDKGVNEEWSLTSFVTYLRKTEEYRKQFVGIFEKDGGLRMSEAQYLAQYKQFSNMAARADFKLSREQFGALIRRNVAADEWQTRTIFLERITRSKQFFDQVEAVARARGILKPKEKLSKKSLYDAMLRRGSPQIERLLEESNVRYQLEQAGFVVGAQGSIGRKMVLNLIKRVEAGGGEAEMMDSKTFADLAEKAKTVIPTARQHGMNLTKRDLFILEFGGPGRQEIARYVENILTSAQREEQEPKGQPQLIEDAGGSRLASGAITSPQQG